MYRCVKQSVTCTLFVRDYAVQIKIEDFHCGNLYKNKFYGKCRRKFRISFPVVYVPSK
jgi:hypothetical protein